ncbi:hypothetical protein AVEN_267820-1 [Araneus ventricosus]|uniref:Uncharacterized protein n=1 Tax=Araneus ventricosus TaxID=182803 RepID=A0A4Y2D3K4_ARAVE|nr:hypothetical protein AVEN_267820-1 [Araneus ventricosus]
MRPSLSPPPLNAPIPSKGPLLPPEEGPLANGSSSPRPARINGVPPPKKSPEDEKIQEYLQRSDTAVIFPEPVGGTSPKQRDEKPNLSPEPTPVIVVRRYVWMNRKTSVPESFRRMEIQRASLALPHPFGRKREKWTGVCCIPLMALQVVLLLSDGFVFILLAP